MITRFEERKQKTCDEEISWKCSRIPRCEYAYKIIKEVSGNLQICRKKVMKYNWLLLWTEWALCALSEVTKRLL